MKNVYIFCTNFLFYLTELPFVLLLVLAIAYNDNMTDSLKLYPLQVFSIIGIVLVFIFFLRFVKIGYDELRSIGPFSKKDSALIREGDKIVITMSKFRKLKIELFGKDTAPALDWVDKESFGKNEVNLFRAGAVGGKFSVSRVLSLYEIEKSDFNRAFGEDKFECESELAKLTSTKKDDGKRVISLSVKKII